MKKLDRYIILGTHNSSLILAQDTTYDKLFYYLYSCEFESNHYKPY